MNKCINIKGNKSIISNISKNKQRIDSLSSFISKESQLAEEKIAILNEEIYSLQNEIANLNHPNTQYSQKDFDQNLIKEKFISKTIKIHENELIQIEENLKLLKEEKLSSSNELLNLMSLRENYEELIKFRAKYIFNSSKIKKNNNEKKTENNQNLTEIDLINMNFNEKKVNIEYHDILNIQSISKLCNFIYKIISSNIVANFSSLLIELNLKSVIFSCIDTAFNKFIKNNCNFSINKSNAFIRDISVNIVNSDIKISSIFIEPQFEILLKYIIKLFSVEKTINDELKFVNNDYPYNKNLLKNKKENILNKINDCNKQKKNIESEKQKIKNDCKKMKNYMDKMQEYKNILKIKESEIKKIKNEFSSTQNIYQGQINSLQNMNIKLEKEYNNGDLKHKKEKINQQIEILFKGIKDKIKNINDNEQKNNFINELIQDIDKCLENDGNLRNNNNSYKTYNIKINDHFSNSSRIQNNTVEINEELNKIIKENINNSNDNDEENEEISISDDFLSSYNSFDDINQEPKTNKLNKNMNYQNIIKSKKNKVIEKKLKNPKNLSLEIGKKGILDENDKSKDNTLSNKNLNINHKNYLKLSECFKFNN